MQGKRLRKKKNLHNQYKILRNSITKLKRESKITYYKKNLNNINLNLLAFGKELDL